MIRRISQCLRQIFQRLRQSTQAQKNQPRTVGGVAKAVKVMAKKDEEDDHQGHRYRAMMPLWQMIHGREIEKIFEDGK